VVKEVNHDGRAMDRGGGSRRECARQEEDAATMASGFGEEVTRGAAPWDEEAARVNNK
jgi:chorismate synthase